VDADGTRVRKDFADASFDVFDVFGDAYADAF